MTVTDALFPLTEACKAYNSAFGNVRSWIFLSDFNLKLYFRRTRRYINGEVCETLELASFEVDGELGQGNFTAFLEHVEPYARLEGVILFVENVLNDRLADFLRRRGYKEVPELPQCLYRSFSDEQ